tara:strand:- start:182 stop:397 length:216 start_codon:yes stop_codon:yes gene_type:complete
MNNIENRETMSKIKVGDRRKFFHPGTFGVMLIGTLKEIRAGEQPYLVRFDDPHPSNGKFVFWTFKESIALR